MQASGTHLRSLLHRSWDATIVSDWITVGIKR